MTSPGRCTSMGWSVLVLAVWVTVLFSWSASPAADAQLTPSFYNKTCPTVASVVQSYVKSAMKNDTRIAASLLRLHFHDCFVNGCDGSVLLDPTSTSPGEKNTIPNQNSLRGFDVIDKIKAGVEKVCPKVVSCADIVALASFYSIVLSGGPSWWIPLGRRDALAANSSLPLVFLPGPQSTVPQLKAKFQLNNLSTTDVVSLSGGHTIGLARCVSFNARLYNFSATGVPDPTINKTLLASLQSSCPQGGDGNVTRKLDQLTNTTFDNAYYKDLLSFNGLMNSDEVLFTAANDTKSLVQLYAKNQTKFFLDFVASMIKMGNLKPLTGTAGEIRLNCRVRNPTSIETTAEEVPSSIETTSEKVSSPIETAAEKAREEAAAASSLLGEAADAAREFIRESIKKIFPDIFLGDEMDHIVEDALASS